MTEQSSTSTGGPASNGPCQSRPEPSDQSTVRAALVFGTRPELIKMAPILRACRHRDLSVTPLVWLTGQHVELLDGTSDYFRIAPDEVLDAMRPSQSLAQLTARLLESLDALLARQRPDVVVVQGDTSSAMACALAAFFRRIPLVHVEAGLRTGDLHSPWPEELNRRIVTLAASLHCAPTQRAVDALADEGVPRRRIVLTGNPVVDALLETARRETAHDARWREKYPWLGDGPMILVTAHRRENIGAGLEGICQAIRRLVADRPDLQVVFPVHPNPEVRECLGRLPDDEDRIRLLPPVPYPEFVWLMTRATLILSDSGGVQEEAPSLGVPVLVTREKTERPEAVESGAALLVGTDPDRIVEAVESALTKRAASGRGDNSTFADSERVNPFGDGKAGERIARLIADRAWADSLTDEKTARD